MSEKFLPSHQGGEPDADITQRGRYHYFTYRMVGSGEFINSPNYKTLQDAETESVRFILAAISVGTQIVIHRFYSWDYDPDESSEDTLNHLRGMLPVIPGNTYTQNDNN